MLYLVNSCLNMRGGEWPLNSLELWHDLRAHLEELFRCHGLYVHITALVFGLLLRSLVLGFLDTIVVSLEKVDAAFEEYAPEVLPGLGDRVIWPATRRKGLRIGVGNLECNEFVLTVRRCAARPR